MPTFLPFRIRTPLAAVGGGNTIYTLEIIGQHERRMIDNISFRDNTNGLTGVEVGVRSPGVDAFIYKSGALAAGAIGQYNGHQIVLSFTDILYLKFAGDVAGDSIEITIEGWVELLDEGVG